MRVAWTMQLKHERVVLYPAPQTNVRSQALFNLWEQALKEIRVRHPDPRVDVRVQIVRHFGAIQVRFKLFNMCDTSNADIKIDDFLHYGSAHDWPGYEVARQYICALWCLYLVHEGQELVTYRGTKTKYSDGERPVIDSHAVAGPNQRALGAATQGYIASTLDWSIGFGEGRRLVEKFAADAKRELDNEIAFLLDT